METLPPPCAALARGIVSVSDHSWRTRDMLYDSPQVIFFVLPMYLTCFFLGVGEHAPPPLYQCISHFAFMAAGVFKRPMSNTQQSQAKEHGLKEGQANGYVWPSQLVSGETGGS